MPASSVRNLSRQWTDRLASYHLHQNDEHLEALVDEAVRYAGLHLENDLASSTYWTRAPLSRRVAVLLFLVDRGVVDRISVRGKRVYLPCDHAETWVSSQTALTPYLNPTLELIAALHRTAARRARPSRP